MDPMEILRKEMDPTYFALVEKLVAQGFTWEWANWTNEAALEGPESPEGLRQFYVVVDFDNEDFETSDAFEDMLFDEK